jgi:hypothetical protein
MRWVKRFRKALSVAFTGLALASPAAADERRSTPPVARGVESFGPGTNYLVIPSTAFAPEVSTSGFVVGANGYLQYSGGGTATFAAPVELPAGALVVNVCGFAWDENALANVAVRWEAREMGDASALPKQAQLAIGSTSPAGTPGYELTCVSLSAPTVIANFQDLDGDGQSHFTWYRVAVGLAPSSLGIGGAVITWLRPISPAPASPTFGDVPTTHLYFRAIEALAASGITAGCGAGNFCPNQNVTRGELAAFLARALGLHWPE